MISQKLKKQPSVFIAPLDLGGIYSSMAYGLKDLGCKVDFLNLGIESADLWTSSMNNYPTKLYQCLYKYYIINEEYSLISKTIIKILFLISQILLIFWITAFIDIIVLKSGEGLGAYKNWDLKLFKKLGKTIIVIFQGSDSRPPFLRPLKPGESDEELKRKIDQTKARVDHARSIATYVIDNPLSSQFQSGRCCIYQIIGIIVDRVKLKPGFERQKQLDAAPLQKDRYITILHAPSLPRIKGSDKIRVVIKKLQDKGRKIKYREISGKPNREVLEAIVESDLVIDELYSDIHGAIFSTEAAAYARASIVGGYGASILKNYVLPDAALPTIFIEPSRLEETLEDLIKNPYKVKQQGKKASEFFNNYGSAIEIAQRLLTLSRGEAPEEWFFDPSGVTYVEGVGGDNHIIAANIRKLLNAYGEEALLLDDKPDLKSKVVQFAYQF